MYTEEFTKIQNSVCICYFCSGKEFGLNTEVIRIYASVT